MKKTISLILILTFVSVSSAGKYDTKHFKNISKKNIDIFRNVNFDKLFKALCQKESGNKKYPNGNPKAIGDNGKAWGIVQIWQFVIIDVNEYGKEKFSSKDRFSVDKSKKICRIYLTRYGKEYYKKTGKIPTYETFARMWNGGGPKGYKYKSTIRYWNDVNRILKNIK
jgi:hypothetical protein